MASRFKVEEVKPSVRAKYTAVDGSPNLVVLGASTGSLYFYERQSMNFLSMYTNPEIKDAVVLVKISPDESKVAIASAKASPSPTYWPYSSYFSSTPNAAGQLVIATVGLGREKEKVVARAEGRELRALCWAEDGSLLYSGDESGLVLATSPAAILRKPEPLLRAEAPIVQICVAGGRVLVSSLHHSTLLPATRIGSKPRDGRYGASFHPALPNLVLCARPGRRLWLADLQGKVLKTITFAAPATPGMFREVHPAGALTALLSDSGLALVDLLAVRVLEVLPFAPAAHAWALHGLTVFYLADHRLFRVAILEDNKPEDKPQAKEVKEAKEAAPAQPGPEPAPSPAQPSPEPEPSPPGHPTLEPAQEVKPVAPASPGQPPPVELSPEPLHQPELTPETKPDLAPEPSPEPPSSQEVSPEPPVEAEPPANTATTESPEPTDNSPEPAPVPAETTAADPTPAPAPAPAPTPALAPAPTPALEHTKIEEANTEEAEVKASPAPEPLPAVAQDPGKEPVKEQGEEVKAETSGPEEATRAASPEPAPVVAPPSPPSPTPPAPSPVPPPPEVKHVTPVSTPPTHPNPAPTPAPTPTPPVSTAVPVTPPTTAKQATAPSHPTPAPGLGPAVVPTTTPATPGKQAAPPGTPAAGPGKAPASPGLREERAELPLVSPVIVRRQRASVVSFDEPAFPRPTPTALARRDLSTSPPGPNPSSLSTSPPNPSPATGSLPPKLSASPASTPSPESSLSSSLPDQATPKTPTTPADPTTPTPAPSTLAASPAPTPAPTPAPIPAPAVPESTPVPAIVDLSASLEASQAPPTPASTPAPAPPNAAPPNPATPPASTTASTAATATPAAAVPSPGEERLSASEELGRLRGQVRESAAEGLGQFRGAVKGSAEELKGAVREWMHRDWAPDLGSLVPRRKEEREREERERADREKAERDREKAERDRGREKEKEREEAEELDAGSRAAVAAVTDGSDTAELLAWAAGWVGPAPPPVRAALTALFVRWVGASEAAAYAEAHELDSPAMAAALAQPRLRPAVPVLAAAAPPVPALDSALAGEDWPAALRLLPALPLPALVAALPRLLLVPGGPPALAALHPLLPPWLFSTQPAPAHLAYLSALLARPDCARSPRLVLAWARAASEAGDVALLTEIAGRRDLARPRGLPALCRPHPAALAALEQRAGAGHAAPDYRALLAARQADAQLLARLPPAELAPLLASPADLLALEAVEPQLATTLLRRAELADETDRALAQVFGHLDTHLWQKKTSVLPPSAVHALHEHLQGRRPPYIGSDNNPLMEGPFHFPPFLEEPPGHWGTRISVADSTCRLCEIPLRASPNTSQSSVINVMAYPCGHAFHEYCAVNETHCPLH